MIVNKDSRENILFFAWAVSILAMFGSLYFSEIRKYEPCVLCWYQRILMYPLALQLGIATVKKDYRFTLYSAWMSAIGMMVSAYHYSLQKLPFMAEAAPACGRVPCTGQYINWLGFITIPFLALMAFTLIFICSMVILKKNKGELA
nr:disulfide oxidoreductase [Neobacillus sp. YIM B06451]